VKIYKNASGKIKVGLNRFDWLKIGFSQNWLRKKAAKSAVINGKLFEAGNIYYDEKRQLDYILEDILKEDDFRYALKATYDTGEEGTITIDLPKKKVLDQRTSLVFEEGDIKENRKGAYKILKIHDDEKYMDVEYVGGEHDGSRQTLDIPSQAKVIYNEQVRENEKYNLKPINFVQPNEYFTLGYLARNGQILVNINTNLTLDFEKIYQELTKDNARQYLGNGYSTREPFRGGDWYKILFPSPSPEVLNNFNFSKDIDANIMDDKGGMQINNRNYIMNLFRMGFHIGRNNNNINDIVSRIENEDNKQDFMAGTTFQGSQRLASIFDLSNLIRL